ncbi:MAG: hypothetical protein M1820_002505 [Bogoriella megaspora]|nr:MAG: hypothetical protein M1820_002505 [Bogoriella megaspora]
MVGHEESVMFHRDVHPDGTSVRPEEREKLLAKVLPEAPSSPRSSSTSPKPSTNRKRGKLRTRLIICVHIILYATIQIIFTIYIRSRFLYRIILDRIYTLLYHPHRTPAYIKNDVSTLQRLPEHLAVILNLDDAAYYNTGLSPLESLVADVSEICTWTASAGIPTLTIYERSGILKQYLVDTHVKISTTLRSYYGMNHPTISLRAPHHQSISPPRSPTSTAQGQPSQEPQTRLEVTLLSSVDGRDTIVDLTKTFAEMAQGGKIGPQHVSPELIDQELSDLTISDPDLLILFGPEVKLDGFPPWQLRLTEIFHVPDHTGVAYHVFLRALYRYAKAQMRFGR